MLNRERVNKDGKNLDEFLAEYDSDAWKKPSVTSDIVLFSVSEEKPVVLLVKRGNHPYIGDWALPGGFLNENESCEDAAKRELKEETGLEKEELEQLVTVSTPNRDPRGWTVTNCFFAVTELPENAVGADDADEADWFFIDCAKKEDVYELVLKNKSGTALNAVMNVKRTKRGVMDINATTIESSDGLAFDHAKIILYAIEKL